MRLRNVEGARDKILENPEHITDIDFNETVNLAEKFTRKQPLHLEIGCGKGRFAHTMARANPEINVLAVEQFDSVIVRALEKQLSTPMNNLHLVRMDAQRIEAMIPDKSLDAIYLNFSDPWPKVRHEKRRLTNQFYLNQYQRMLKPGGRIEFKTDNRHFFEYSLQSFNAFGMRIDDLTLNLHADHYPENIMTEFEMKFKDDGPIYKTIVRFEEANQ